MLSPPVSPTVAISPRKIAAELKAAGCTPFAVGFLTKAAVDGQSKSDLRTTIAKVALVNEYAADELSDGLDKAAANPMPFIRGAIKGIPKAVNWFGNIGTKGKDALRSVKSTAKPSWKSTNTLNQAAQRAATPKLPGPPPPKPTMGQKAWGTGMNVGGRALSGYTGGMAGQSMDPTGTYDPGHYLGLGEGSLGHWNAGRVLGTAYGAMSGGKGMPKSMSPLKSQLNQPFRNAQAGALLGEGADMTSDYASGYDPAGEMEYMKQQLGVDDYYQILSGDFELPEGVDPAAKQQIMDQAQQYHHNMSRGGKFQQLGATTGALSGLPGTRAGAGAMRSAGLGSKGIQALAAPGKAFGNIVGGKPGGALALAGIAVPTVSELAVKPALRAAGKQMLEGAAPEMESKMNDVLSKNGLGTLEEMGGMYQSLKDGPMNMLEGFFGKLDGVLGPIFGEGFTNLPMWAKGMILTGGVAALGGLLTGNTGVGLGGIGLAAAPLIFSMMSSFGKSETAAPDGSQEAQTAATEEQLGGTEQEVTQQAQETQQAQIPPAQGWANELQKQGIPSEQLIQLAQQDPQVAEFLQNVDPVMGMKDPETRNIIMGILGQGQQQPQQ